jgi:ferritin-like metal-binding protein YciE
MIYYRPLRCIAPNLQPSAPPMSSLTPTLHALLIHELKDLFYAENHLIKALPRMARAATNAELKAGFTAHLAETRTHVTRLTEALKILGLPAKGKVCHAMLGLIEEGAEAIDLKGPAAVRDAALISSAQRVEHYEMAGYGTARAFAQAVGENRVAQLLQQTLDEEGDTNKKLTVISETVNAAARDGGGQIPAVASKKKK